MKMEVSHPSGGSVPAVEESAKSEAVYATRREISRSISSGSLSLRTAGSTLLEHWPEYLIEAGGLSFFMISACFFAALIFHPSSAVNRSVPSPLAGRVLMGAMMGLTAVAIIYSPWGKRSGAHINPATTLTFLRLGKVAVWDAVPYMLAQFAGGIAGASEVRRLSKGDVIVIPAGVAHWFKEVEGTLLYYVVKVR